ncbi:10859_t:CDS:2 [Acaulospora colombiana]|uniref:10859_t:CDS:1 n=1 Tax=Acaulospora colombiana TaxID=27376 RepID=A0ACA9KZT0_9GLOM|nr:10859_t:CDS:2 [Acaulospora colombiana]
MGVSSFDILGLLAASGELLLEELTNNVQTHFLEHGNSWIKENFITVLHAVFRLASCRELKDYCLESICSDPSPLFDSESFPSLDKDIFLELIKREGLKIEEVNIWEYLIKWGICRLSGIEEKKPSNVKEFSERNIKDLKKIIDPFIPYIRFYEISRKDFHDKVWPFQKVLPESLFEDVISFLMTATEPRRKILPPRIKSIIDDSKILTREHLEIITNWIEKKDIIDKEKRRYHFTLLYRGTRDGFDAKSFHQNVDGQGPAIAVIKIKNSGKIVGGFNTSGWNGNSIDNFIFSMGSQNNHITSKIDRLKGKCSVYDKDDIMIRFGNYGLILDSGRNGTCHKSILDTNSFPAEEVELFSVIEKDSGQ